MFDDEVPCISLYKMLETKTNNQYLFDFSYVFIELKKFDKDKFDNTIDEWLHFIWECCRNQTSPPANIKSEKVLDAYSVIEMHNLTPEEYDAYIRAKLMEDAEEIALEEKFEKGKAEEKIIIAKKMLIKQRPIVEIHEITELPIERIEKLKNRNVIEMHNLTPEEYDAYIRAKLMEDAEEIALEEKFEKGRKLRGKQN